MSLALASLSSLRAADERRAPLPYAQLGSWRLTYRIAAGSFAEVYAARAAESRGGQPASYALKVLREQWREDPRCLTMLAREVQVAQSVAHPHLAPVLAAELSRWPYYLTLPLLEGCSLEEVLRVGTPLDSCVAFWIARQVAEALEALHREGWMHGDIKPSNVHVSASGHATLLDLGFARREDEHASLADRPLLGTLAYLAPEMFSALLGGGPASDIYSLGVMLFQLLAGRLPFDADEISELALQHRQELPGDLRTRMPHLPVRAARLVQQMLAKEPLRRPRASDVVARLTSLEIETFAERSFAELSAAES